MFCKNCGNRLDDKAVICVNCGIAVNYPPPVATVKKSNACAIAGFILSFFGIIGMLFSLLGLILSIVGLTQSKKCQSGKGFGIAGIPISVCAFFVHGVIMMYLMPYIIQFFGGMFMFFVLFLIL